MISRNKGDEMTDTRLTEDYVTLDIRDLSRAGCLIAGTHPWQSRCGRVRFGLVRRPASLEIIYGGSSLGSVALTQTRCNYGGARLWFRCPQADCGRRCGTVYFVDSQWCCRICGGLRYPSQHENS